ncbi:MAG TPA: hypothetical protein VF006_06730 [Longimicrobium sp.]
MSDTQGFQFDVYNNTGRVLTVQMTDNTCLKGAQIGPQGMGITIPASEWMSAQNNGVPFPLTLNTCDTGALTCKVQDVSTGANSPFTLEFDGTQLTNFSGMAFYGSAGDIAQPVQIIDGGSVGYIFPLLYMNQTYNGDPLAVVMLLQATGASSAVATPYKVS